LEYFEQKDASNVGGSIARSSNDFS